MPNPVFWFHKAFITNSTNCTAGEKEDLKKAVLALIVLILTSSVAVSSVLLLDADAMWIEPEVLSFFTNSTEVGSRFNITIWLNVTSPTNAWLFFLVYNNAYLTATACNYTGVNKSQWSNALPADIVEPDFGSHNTTHDYVLHGEMLKDSAEHTGSGSLSWVEFEIIQSPGNGEVLTSELRLDTEDPFYSLAWDADLNSIALIFGKADYTYTYATEHDVAVLSVSPQESVMSKGLNVTVASVVSNLGDFAETFNVTLYANTTEIGKQNVTLAFSENKTLTFIWDTSGFAIGNYTVEAVADVVSEETETENNIFIDGVVEIIPYHDVAITNVTSSETTVVQGYILSINVTAENQGDYTETFNVTLCANTTIIDTTEIVLTSANSTILTFNWNTTSFGDNYVLNAYASTVQYEIDTTDNNYTDGVVIVEYHDVAITDLSYSPREPYAFVTILINVTVVNKGTSSETFNVSVNYTLNHDPLIGTQTVTLAPKESKTLTFTWVQGPARYIITAYTSTIPKDTNLSDNEKITYLIIAPYVIG